MNRISALLDGKRVDRVPVFQFALGFCARNVGYPIAAIYQDPEKSLQAQLWSKEMYGWDNAPFYGYASYGSWEFGGPIEFPSSELQQAPTIPYFPVQSEEDIKGLKLPAVKRAGMLPFAMEFSQLQKRLDLPITVVVGGVFTLAGNICGVDRLCRWMLKKPELAHQIIRLSTDHILDVVQYWGETFGAERVIPYILEPLAANQIISPGQFEKFVLPYEKEAHEKMLSMGIKHILCHICGEQNLNIPFWEQIPMGNPGIVTFGKEVNLATAIRHFGDKCIIAGNVEPRILQEGTPQEVYEAMKQCVIEGKDSPRGFIAMLGCELPPMAPPYNVHTMMKAVNDFGRYS
ncbi:MAG: uroporphyrinogen decarboxylase family protein [Dehalococcoidia bacterium]|nr:uroporphyrinogen decarboxylase family protein [Dehalococcoidia bacterium]